MRAGTAKRAKRDDPFQQEFQREQMRLQSLARLREGRASAVDELARAFFAAKGEAVPGGLEDPLAPLAAPQTFLDALSPPALAELLAQLAKFKSVFCGAATDALFWHAFELLVEARRQPWAAVDDAVSPRVEAVLAGKGRTQLAQLRGEVALELEGTSFAAEKEFWRAVLQRLGEEEARLSLEEFLAAQQALPCGKDSLADDDELILGPVEGGEVAEDFDAYAEAVNKQALSAFLQSLVARAAPQPLSSAKAEELAQSLRNDRFPPPSQPFSPLRPHFFVRVKLGYEWNAFNRSRHTREDPPPRSVFGYRFNLFFPRKLTAEPPTYALHAQADPELALLTFSGGAPYEPLAFRVLNAPWDMADRKSFRCAFENGVFHLHFDFLGAGAKRL